MSRHACECDNKDKNMSRHIFIFGGALACCRTFVLSQKSVSNGHSPAACHTLPVFFFLAGVACNKNCAKQALTHLHMHCDRYPVSDR